MNVLVVEDNRRIGSVLRQGLTEAGCQVTIAERGDQGRDLMLSTSFDVAVLDVMLPGLDGFSVLRQARAESCNIPVLMLTARDTMPDVVQGLDLGADDYLTTPFHLEVFIARVRAIARRRPALDPTHLSVGDLTLDTTSRVAFRDGKILPLTKKEYALLELLVRRKNQLVTRNQLRDAGWSYDSDVSDNSVDYYMHSLRSKIDLDAQESSIRTVRSLGYTLTVPKE